MQLADILTLEKMYKMYRSTVSDFPWRSCQTESIRILWSLLFIVSIYVNGIVSFSLFKVPFSLFTWNSTHRLINHPLPLCPLQIPCCSVPLTSIFYTHGHWHVIAPCCHCFVKISLPLPWPHLRKCISCKATERPRTSGSNSRWKAGDRAGGNLQLQGE